MVKFKDNRLVVTSLLKFGTAKLAAEDVLIRRKALLTAIKFVDRDLFTAEEYDRLTTMLQELEFTNDQVDLKHGTDGD